jgi:hypothetical protein
MAAGLTRKQRKQRVYSRLQRIAYKLQQNGVTVVYKKFQLFAETTGLTHLNGFNIQYDWSFASNGESAGFLRVTIDWNGETTVYGWQRPAGSAEAGLNRIVELFSRIAPDQRTVKF